MSPEEPMSAPREAGQARARAAKADNRAGFGPRHRPLVRVPADDACGRYGPVGGHAAAGGHFGKASWGRAHLDGAHRCAARSSLGRPSSWAVRDRDPRGLGPPRFRVPGCGRGSAARDRAWRFCVGSAFHAPSRGEPRPRTRGRRRDCPQHPRSHRRKFAGPAINVNERNSPNWFDVPYLAPHCLRAFSICPSGW